MKYEITDRHNQVWSTPESVPVHLQIASDGSLEIYQNNGVLFAAFAKDLWVRAIRNPQYDPVSGTKYSIISFGRNVYFGVDEKMNEADGSAISDEGELKRAPPPPPFVTGPMAKAEVLHGAAVFYGGDIPETINVAYGPGYWTQVLKAKP